MKLCDDVHKKCASSKGKKVSTLHTPPPTANPGRIISNNIEKHHKVIQYATTINKVTPKNFA